MRLWVWVTYMSEGEIYFVGDVVLGQSGRLYVVSKKIENNKGVLNGWGDYLLDNMSSKIIEFFGVNMLLTTPVPKDTHT